VDEGTCGSITATFLLDRLISLPDNTKIAAPESFSRVEINFNRGASMLRRSILALLTLSILCAVRPSQAQFGLGLHLQATRSQPSFRHPFYDGSIIPIRVTGKTTPTWKVLACPKEPTGGDTEGTTSVTPNAIHYESIPEAVAIPHLWLRGFSGTEGRG
jgi:hypothetical protein